MVSLLSGGALPASDGQDTPVLAVGQAAEPVRIAVISRICVAPASAMGSP